MNTNLLQLTPNDAYAFRRVLSKMDVPDDLVLSPLASLLLKSLDPQNNPDGWQTLQDIVSVGSIDSVANKRINPRWFPKFISAPIILIRMDEDKAGLETTEQIRKLSQAVKYVQVPKAKDINDFYQLAGYEATLKWLNNILAI